MMLGVRLKGKTAVVTAAGQGIGHAIAQRFLAEGCTVIATDIRIDKLGDGDRLSTHVLDVTDAQAISVFAKSQPQPDILVNVAGFVHDGSILQCDEGAWDLSLSLNLTAMYRVVRAFLPAMLDAGGGSIINVSSVASSIKGVPNRFAYSTTKAGVIGLTKSIAADFVDKGIRCNAICPGTVETPSLRARIAALAESKGIALSEAVQEFTGRQPMGRLGKADEIAALAAYLASDEAAFTTGTSQIIDGGWTN